MTRKDITREIAAELLDYDPATGSFVWRPRDVKWYVDDPHCRAWNTKFAGRAAGTTDSGSGYLHLRLFNIKFYTHQIAFLLSHGYIPREIDHINGAKSDNRISNLRHVDRITNCRNAARRSDNTSGKAGVTRSGNSWLARIGSGNARLTLGSFSTLEAAIAARETAEKSLGYTERHGV